MRLNEDNVKASVCRDSFFQFVKRFWHTIITEDPVWNWHIYELCNELQEVAERVERREPKAYDLVINVPPGSTKSTICSEMYPAWIWTRFPAARFICGSHTNDLTEDLALKTRDIVVSEDYQTCFPKIRLRDDKQAVKNFHNTKGGQRKATTVGSKITGRHAHFIIVDDPIDPEGARSDAEMKVANRWMEETLPSRAVNRSVTPTILIMQRLHQNDPSANMIKFAKKPDAFPVKHICIPAEKTNQIKPLRFRKYYQNNLFDPIRLPKRVLNSIKARGDYAYAGQYLQNPIPEEGGEFDVVKITIEDHPPIKLKKVCRYWDKAGTPGDGDYSAGVKMGIDYDDRVWILHAKRGQWRAYNREQVIKQTAALDGREVPIRLEQEPGSAGKESAENSVKNLMGYDVAAKTVTGDKPTRAVPFARQVGGGNVYMVKGDWNAEYLAELEHFPFGLNDDQVDASSGAFNEMDKFKPRVGAFGRTKK